MLQTQVKVVLEEIYQNVSYGTATSVGTLVHMARGHNCITCSLSHDGHILRLLSLQWQEINIVVTKIHSSACESEQCTILKREREGEERRVIPIAGSG